MYLTSERDHALKLHDLKWVMGTWKMEVTEFQFLHSSNCARCRGMVVKLTQENEVGARAVDAYVAASAF